MLRGVNLWQIQAEFLVAIQYGDIDACISLLAAGVDCDQFFKVNCQSRPALSLAVARSEYELVELFIKNGSSINLPDSSGSTALHTAVQTGSEEICNLLIQNRASVNAVDNLGVCPLHLAVQRGSLSLTELLLKHGADVNRVDQSGKSALHYACSVPKVSHEIVNLLVQNGTYLDDGDETGLTPLLYILQTSSYAYETFQLFVQNGARLDKATGGKAPIHLIVLSSSQDKWRCLNLLLKNNCDINAQTNKKQTALHLSVLMNDIESIKILLRASATPNTIDRLGMSPFTLAISLGLTDIIDLLLGVGIKMNLEAVQKLNLTAFPKPYQQYIIDKLCSPSTLMEISRNGIFKYFGTKSFEKIHLFDGKEIPSSAVPFLLLET